MSDVTQAPPPPSSPPPAPAPQGEVPINPNPVNPPAPVGSQAPPKAPQSKPEHKVDSPAQSRRDSIAEAFRKSRDPEWQRSRPGPAQAAKGHNHPPEKTPDEKPRPAPLDLKKRPDEQPGAQSAQGAQGAQKPRGERGRFAPREENPELQARRGGPPGGVNPQQGARPNPLPPHAPYREPVRGMSQRAAADWHAAPESVRGDMHRMHHEFKQAAQRYHTDHAAMNGIRHYHDLARQQGTSLDKVLGNYTGIEHKLRADPIGGLDLIVNNLNLQAPDGRRLGLRDIAWHVLNQTPEQLQLTQAGNTQAAQAAQLAEMRRQQAALAQHLQHMQYQQQFAHARGGVDRFAETHPRLDELGHIVERELKLGFDLETAYKRAELLSPATRAAETRNNQQRIPDRSIRGAPESANGAGRARPKSSTRQEAIARSIAAVRGAM
jgi:hypothetical protein